MKPDIKALWLAALRDPNTRQTRHTLTNEEGSCCLGVLCEIAVKQGIIPPPAIIGADQKRYYGPAEGVRGACGYLPTEVVVWAGLAENDPHLGPDTYASTLNDVQRLSLPQIADIIEEKL